MRRTIAHVSISGGLLFVTDHSGSLRCLDAATGKVHWFHDLFAACYMAAPLIVDGKVYVVDEDGDVEIFKLSREKVQLGSMNMGSSVYAAPIVANDVLFIACKGGLFAIAKGAQSKPLE